MFFLRMQRYEKQELKSMISKELYLLSPRVYTTRESMNKLINSHSS